MLLLVVEFDITVLSLKVVKNLNHHQQSYTSLHYYYLPVVSSVTALLRT